MSEAEDILEARIATLFDELHEARLREREVLVEIKVLQSRMQDLMEIRDLLRPNTEDGKPARQPRRDIRAMVRAEIAAGNVIKTPEELAHRLGCRPSQVRDALAALAGEARPEEMQ